MIGGMEAVSRVCSQSSNARVIVLRQYMNTGVFASPYTCSFPLLMLPSTSKQNPDHASSGSTTSQSSETFVRSANRPEFLLSDSLEQLSHRRRKEATWTKQRRARATILRSQRQDNRHYPLAQSWEMGPSI